MLMDRNITQGTSKTTMTWAEAMKYVNSNNLNNTWNNVLNIKLPSAQAIANAIGNNYFDITSGVSRLCFEDKNNSTTCTHTNYDDLWLWDYTRECQGCNNSLSSTEAYGYWTENLVNTTSYSWIVYRYGQLSYDSISSSGDYGFRPVITVLKSQLN